MQIKDLKTKIDSYRKLVGIVRNNKKYSKIKGVTWLCLVDWTIKNNEQQEKTISTRIITARTTGTPTAATTTPTT